MIVKSHGVIVIEGLKVAPIMKSGRVSIEQAGTMLQKKANADRALLDVSPRMIRSMLEYKAPWLVRPRQVTPAASQWE